MTLEPDVTMAPKLGYDEVHHPDWFEPHAGLDESGKGDLFGPVIADHLGHVEIPIEVPPGVRTGQARAVDRNGAARETEVDLRLPTFPLIVLLAPPIDIPEEDPETSAVVTPGPPLVTLPPPPRCCAITVIVPSSFASASFVSP